MFWDGTRVIDKTFQTSSTARCARCASDLRNFWAAGDDGTLLQVRAVAQAAERGPLAPNRPESHRSIQTRALSGCCECGARFITAYRLADRFLTKTCGTGTFLQSLGETEMLGGPRYRPRSHVLGGCPNAALLGCRDAEGF